jgi:hypothetical protein
LLLGKSGQRRRHLALRNLTLTAFGFVILGTVLDWFRFELPNLPPGVVFQLSGLEIQQRGETIILFAIAGAAFTFMGRGLTGLIVPTLAAAMALVIVIYTYRDPYPVHQDLVVLEGYYLTLIAAATALAACLLRWREYVQDLRASRVASRTTTAQH